MIPPDLASRITFKAVMLNSKIVVLALMIGLAVVTVVLAVVQFTTFGQGVLKNEPELSTILIIVAAVLWVVLIPAGYFAPELIFGDKERRIISEGQQSISLRAGSDAEASEQAIGALDSDIRAELLSNYMARVLTRFALFEGAGMINAVFFLMSGSIANLLLVLATLIVMAVLFPTLAQFRQWLECLSAA